DNFDLALAGVLGVDLDQLSREWRYSLEQRFFPAYAQRPPLDVGATTLVDEGVGNFQPVLHAFASDTTLFFLSTRSGYTNVYALRWGARGRSLETVLEGERSAEFESFHAYESSFDVSADGLLAISSRFLDRDALLIWDPEAHDVVGRYQWPGIVGVRSPAWSRDGSRVVFTGLSTAGFADLYMLDFATQQLHRLTNDRYRDEEPDFSPDGRTIVFASDRTRFGPGGATNLVLLDVETGAMRFLTWGDWRDRSPRYSPDGRQIAFSSDRGGSSDLYGVGLTGTGRRVTELTGGAFDPAWAPDGRSIAFAGFQNQGLRIYRQSLAPAGEAIALDERVQNGNGHVSLDEWQWPELEAPALATASPQPYDSWKKLSIDFAAADAMYAPGYASAQGAQFLASDMLGDHILFLGISAFQAGDLSQFVDSFSGSALYLNLANRLNYGFGIFRYNGLFRDVSWDIYEDAGMGGFFVASYPLSPFRRIELQLGLQKGDRTDIED